MLENNEYNNLKDSFIESERLFVKLANVSDSFSNIDYDESGLYHEDEEMYKRHWLKLSSKIVDALSESLQEHDIELLESKNLELKELTLNLIKNDVVSKININFDEIDSIKITQIS